MDRLWERGGAGIALTSFFKPMVLATNGAALQGGYQRDFHPRVAVSDRNEAGPNSWAVFFFYTPPQKRSCMGAC
jgi:hypothetical protein